MFVLFGVLKLQSIYQFFGGPLTHPRRYCRDRDVFLKDHLGQDDGSEGQDTDHEEHASQVWLGPASPGWSETDGFVPRGGLDSQTTSTVWLPTVQQLKVFGKIWQQLWVCWSILPGWIWSLWQVSGRPDAQQIPGVGNGQHRLFSIAYAAEQLKFESCCKLRCSAPMCLTSPAMPEKQKSGDPGWILDGYKLILTSLLVSMG